MAKFSIYSKDGNTVRYTGKLRYSGSYLNVAYVEFPEICSPIPIDWEVGDYVFYERTGFKYSLYSIPQAKKQARNGATGDSFIYSNVQFFEDSKDLEIAPFRDLVKADNKIHFSTNPDVSTFENVYGICDRLQACMDDLFTGKWEIRVVDTIDETLIEKLSEAKEFTLSNATCKDALSMVYELYGDIGWSHILENGKNVIVIGYSNQRTYENTTTAFSYGRGKGLTSLKANQINKDAFANRVYLYGSTRNMRTDEFRRCPIWSLRPKLRSCRAESSADSD